MLSWSELRCPQQGTVTGRSLGNGNPCWWDIFGQFILITVLSSLVLTLEFLLWAPFGGSSDIICLVPEAFGLSLDVFLLASQ